MPRREGAAAWSVAALPYALLVPTLAEHLAWGFALANAALLAAAMLAHAFCYRLWHPFAPGRILANELLARLWFAVYAALVAGWLGLAWQGVAAFGAAWAAATWLAHARLVRHGGYRVAENLALLGTFLLGLALALGVH